MKYDLVQYGCDVCGELTEVLDADQPLPKGWLMASTHTHVCPRCKEAILIDTTQQYGWIRQLMKEGGGI